MTRVKSIFAAVVVAVIVGLVPAQATTSFQVVAAGSSAMFQQMTIAAYNDLCTGSTPAHTGCAHWTAKNGSSGASDLLNDSRVPTDGTGPIPQEGGTLSVVWGVRGDGSGITDVWGYLTVDSVVGNRCYFAQPHCTILTNGSGTAGQNKIVAALFSDTSSDSALDATVAGSLNGHVITAAMTDIRPEDAVFAQKRVCAVLNTSTLAGLGYCAATTNQVGTQILGAASASGGAATPVCFNTSGHDCINTGSSVPASTTIPVGAAPIIFLVNRTTGGKLDASQPLNINTFAAQRLFAGLDCESSAIDVISNGAVSGAVHVVMREPLSGTMNTTEFTTFRTVASPKNSQEVGVGANNPVAALPCVHGGGDRTRAIGTGNLVGFVKATTDSIGYAFFSYGNVSGLTSATGNTNFGYLTLNGSDPIGNADNTFPNQQLPFCAIPCALAANTSFPTLRNGGYQAWSILRAVTDKTGVNNTNVAALVAAAQKTVNSKVPDFVPFTPQADGDNGLLVFRSHYGTGPHNGINETDGDGSVGDDPEAGQDMGGCIILKADEVAIANDTVKEILNCKQ
jgi:hypothetical protein